METASGCKQLYINLFFEIWKSYVVRRGGCNKVLESLIMTRMIDDENNGSTDYNSNMHLGIGYGWDENEKRVCSHKGYT
jgi:hypothetical protein